MVMGQTLCFSAMCTGPFCFRFISHRVSILVVIGSLFRRGNAHDQLPSKYRGVTVDCSFPNFVWPKLLVLPPRNVLSVYLDLNYWIGLAQAHSGHPIGAN